MFWVAQGYQPLTSWVEYGTKAYAAYWEAWKKALAASAQKSADFYSNWFKGAAAAGEAGRKALADSYAKAAQAADKMVPPFSFAPAMPKPSPSPKI